MVRPKSSQRLQGDTVGKHHFRKRMKNFSSPRSSRTQETSRNAPAANGVDAPDMDDEALYEFYNLVNDTCDLIARVSSAFDEHKRRLISASNTLGT